MPLPIPPSRRNALLLALALLATAISIATTGFNFGQSNNVFHIPYVLRLGELPVFRGDAFYQSLEKFTSLIWPLLRLVSTEQNVEQVFFIGHWLSRAGAFVALCWFFQANGAVRVASVLVSLLTVAVCPWLMDTSSVGGHGLFLRYFTHSEVTWGPLVAALVAAQRGRLTLSAIFAGIVFSINAFVGLWLVSILVVCVAWNATQRADWRLLARSSLAFFLVCMPVAIWIAFAIFSSAPVPAYSYIDYIRIYFPDHFLIEAATTNGMRDLAILSYCGMVAALLHANRRFWVTSLSACVALLVLGALLPYALNSRFVFNLHLLRVDGVLQFLAIILAISASVGVLMEPKNSTSSRLVAALAAASLMSVKSEPLYLLVCATCLSYLAMRQFIDARAAIEVRTRLWRRTTNVAAALLVTVAMATDFFHLGMSNSAMLRWLLILGIMFFLMKRTANARTNAVAISILWALLAAHIVVRMFLSDGFDAAEKSNSQDRSSIAMTQWVLHSRLPGPLLFPVDRPYRNMFNEFQLRTQKPVWVDWRQGAAVMWEPSFYWQWMPRFQEVSALSTREDFERYAVARRIPYLVLPYDKGGCPDSAKTLYDDRLFSVCAVQLPVE